MNPIFLPVLTASLAFLILNVTGGSNIVVFGQTVSGTPTVKITHPTPDQQIITNNGTLVISGISSDNSTSNCEISIIANNVKPYQRALPKKDTDYSSWSFTLGPSYTPLKEGQNKLTSKITCLASPVNATKWYSVNFTGVFKDITTSDNQSQESSNNTDINTNNTQLDSLNKTSESTGNVSSQISAFTPLINQTNLLVSVKIDKNPVTTGSLQVARLNLTHSNTRQPLTNATVAALITSPSGKSIEFQNMTDAAGKTSFSWKVAIVAETGIAHIKFKIFAPGYESKEITATYEVVKNSSPTNLNPFT